MPPESRAEPATLPPPNYLNEVEQLVGVRFFADAARAETARQNPAELAPEDITLYGGLYLSGLRLLVEARRRFGAEPAALTVEQRQAIRQDHQDEIARIQDTITRHAPVLPGRPDGAITATPLRNEVHLARGKFDAIVAPLDPVMIAFKLSRKTAHGHLHFTGADAERIRQIAGEIPVMTEGDVRALELQRELRTDLDVYRGVLAAIGVSVVDKRSGPESGVMVGYLTAAEADAVRAHYRSIEDLTGLQSIADIAQAAQTTSHDVWEHLRWHGFGIVRRRVRSENDTLVMGDFLPDTQANQVIAELSAIVPNEYLTIGEYARLRGFNDIAVRRSIDEHNLPTHGFTKRDTTTRYLDGATMLKLDKLVKKTSDYEEGWHTMKELETEFDALDHTIASHFDAYEGEIVRTMTRTSGDGTAPHYSPGFREYLRTVIKPKGRPAERTSLRQLISLTGMTGTGLIAAMRREGVDVLQVRLGGSVENFYLDTDLERVLPKLPAQTLPYGGVDLQTLAEMNSANEPAIRSRLKNRGIGPAGKYQAGSRGTRNYYRKSEVTAAGYKVPASAAFPAGERPYGPYGPARAHPQNSPATSHAGNKRETDTPPPVVSPPKAEATPVGKPPATPEVKRRFPEPTPRTNVELARIMHIGAVDMSRHWRLSGGRPDQQVGRDVGGSYRYYLDTAQAALAARSVIRERLAHRPSAQVDIFQLSAMVALHPKEVFARLQDARVRSSGTAELPAYNGVALQRALGLFGVQL
jgi:hypothetical protein